jgi:hypothetical protein
MAMTVLLTTGIERRRRVGPMAYTFESVPEEVRSKHDEATIAPAPTPTVGCVADGLHQFRQTRRFFSLPSAKSDRLTVRRPERIVRVGRPRERLRGHGIEGPCPELCRPVDRRGEDDARSVGRHRVFGEGPRAARAPA